MFGNVVKPWHLLILVAVLVLLFGAKRLPGAARSLGRSLRIIKSETRGLVDDPEPDDLDEKASAQSGRKPLHREQGAEEARTGEGRTEGRTGDSRTGEARGEDARAGEVVDPPERAHDR